APSASRGSSGRWPRWSWAASTRPFPCSRSCWRTPTSCRANTTSTGSRTGRRIGASTLSSFGPDDLLACYASGVFPMGEARDDPRVFLVEPELRGVLPLDRFHVPARLARTVRQDRFE